MKTNTINKTKALFLTILMLMSILIISIKVNAADGTASLSADQVAPNQTVTLTLTISGADFASAGISIAGVKNATLVTGPNSNVYQQGSSFNITTDLANNSSTSHTYVVNFSYSSEGAKPINISYDLISADLNRTVLNRAFTVNVVAPAPTPTPVPTPAPTPKPTTKATTRATTKSTTQTKPTTKSTSTKSQDSNDKNYRDINKKMILTSDLDIRSDASLSSTYLGSYDKGTVVDVIGITDNGWYVINYNGKTAYLAGSYLEDYSSPSSTKADEEESNSEETTTTSKNDDESKTSTTNKDDKADKTKKTEKSNTEKTSTDKDSPALINNNDSDMNAGNSNKSLFAKLDPTMLVIFGLLLLLIILLIVYYILKRRILADEEQEEFEELPGDNNEAIYANKSSDIEVSRVDDSKSSEK